MGLKLLPPFILYQVPYAILIYVVIKRPGRRAFTFLIALLAHPILMILFNPLVRLSYRQSFTYNPIDFLLLVSSDLILVAILVLVYNAIQQTGLRPAPSSVILATVAIFFYFFFVQEITPYLYSFRG
jgi:hypothetical protein